MNIAPATQTLLLALAAADQSTRRLSKQRTTHPELVEYEAAAAALRACEQDVSAAALREDTLTRELQRVQRDVEQMRTRIIGDTARLERATGAEQVELRRDLEAAFRRQSQLDAELAETEAHRAAHGRQREALIAHCEAARATAEQARYRAEEATADMAREEQQVTAERARLREAIPAAVLATYDAEYASSGIAVAPLQERTCSVCFTVLEPDQVDRLLSDADASYVPQCRGCNTWLMRDRRD